MKTVEQQKQGMLELWQMFNKEVAWYTCEIENAITDARIAGLEHHKAYAVGRRTGVEMSYSLMFGEDIDGASYQIF